MTGRLMAALLVVSVLHGGGPAASSQLARPVATSSLSGVVSVDDGTASPLRRVTLTLAGAELPAARIALSDDQGRFMFDRLPAGRYTLTAARAGYVRAAFGARRGWRSSGVPIALGAGEHLAGLTLRMLRGAVLTGHIRDLHGRPLPGVRLNIGELRTEEGRLTLTAATSRAVVTDDRGQYRAYGLPPGRFVVAAEYRPALFRRAVETTLPDEGPFVGYVPIYYPGTGDVARAETIPLAAGEERAGVDFAVRPVRMATLSGVVNGLDTAPTSQVRVTASPVDAVAGAGRFATVSASTNPQGEFTIDAVPPGRHAIRAVVGSRAAMLWAQALVDVDGQSLSGLELNLRPGMSVSGRVVVDSAAPSVESVRRTSIRLRPWSAQSPVAVTPRPATVQADGAFRIDGVVPGSYLVSVQPPASSGADALMVRSATVDDVDLLANVLDLMPGGSRDGLLITLTDRVTEIAGRLSDASDRPVSEYLVLVFPADRRLWALGAERLRAPVHPATDGQYAVGGLPPGDYYLAALTDVEPGDHLDPDFLELLVPSAVPITLADGERKRQDLRVAR